MKPEFYKLLWSFGQFLHKHTRPEKLFRINVLLLRFLDKHFDVENKHLPQVKKYLDLIILLLIQNGALLHPLSKKKKFSRLHSDSRKQKISKKFYLSQVWSDLFKQNYYDRFLEKKYLEYEKIADKERQNAKKEKFRSKIKTKLPKEENYSSLNPIENSRANRTIGVLGFKIIKLLQKRTYNREDLSLLTDFSKQRVCTVLSIYKLLDIVVEDPNTNKCYWNTKQSRILPDCQNYVKDLLLIKNYRYELVDKVFELKVKLRQKYLEKCQKEKETIENNNNLISKIANLLEHLKNKQNKITLTEDMKQEIKERIMRTKKKLEKIEKYKVVFKSKKKKNKQKKKEFRYLKKAKEKDNVKLKEKYRHNIDKKKIKISKANRNKFKIHRSKSFSPKSHSSKSSFYYYLDKAQKKKSNSFYKYPKSVKPKKKISLRKKKHHKKIKFKHLKKKKTVKSTRKNGKDYPYNYKISNKYNSELSDITSEDDTLSLDESTISSSDDFIYNDSITVSMNNSNNPQNNPNFELIVNNVYMDNHSKNIVSNITYEKHLLQENVYYIVNENDSIIYLNNTQNETDYCAKDSTVIKDDLNVKNSSLNSELQLDQLFQNEYTVPSQHSLNNNESPTEIENNQENLLNGSENTLIDATMSIEKSQNIKPYNEELIDTQINFFTFSNISNNELDSFDKI
ncbi:protein disulfide isomerase ptac5 [Anaeramoeba flamelloides]|uniref:Protein disulfide isomerase ptac5 n=1 Tax=Anaeramoeba flamelloides TaxID=1746091 RepID=A0AAV7YJU3_9EUKA|nr:protein disulfide isomerase ptac5 [Anaeramoeba flamelloides]